MKYPYLRTTDCLKRDCTHCASFLSFQRESDDPDEDIDYGTCDNADDQVGSGYTCDLWSDRYTPRVEIKVNKE